MAALAQSQIETVVVTAEKRAEDVTKVPLTVHALGGEDLQRQGINNLKDLVAMVPGASLIGESSQGTEVYQMRGVAVGDTTGDATVASYLDDFAYSIPGVPYAPPTDLYDINRVEALEGPQGTLYGSSSLGGVIKVVTNDPNLESFDTSAELSYGKIWNHSSDYSANLMVNIPVIDDTLAVRVVASGKHLGGFSEVPPLGLHNANNADIFLGRVKVLYKPTEKLSFLASYWHYTVGQAFTNRLDDNDPPTDISFGRDGRAPTGYTLGTFRVNYDLGWADLTSASGYMHRNYEIILRGCQIELCYDLNTATPTHEFNEELRLSSKGTGPLRWVAGFFYLDATNYGTTDFDISAPLVPSPTQAPAVYTNSKSTIGSREYAGFGEISYDLFGGALRPLVGIRYSAVTRDREEQSITILGGRNGIPVSDVDETADAAFYHISPRFNLSWYPTDDGMVYVNVAEGYRPGALQTASQVAELEAVLGVQTATQLKTDSLWSYELGSKWAFFDRALSIQATGYLIKWDRAQLQTGLSGVSGILNVGNVSGKGLELSITHYTPIPGLSWQFSGNINETILDSIDPNIIAGLPFLHDGMQLSPVPKLTGTFIVNYSHDLGINDMIFVASGRYTHQSKTSDLSTGRVAADLNIFNATVGVQKDNYLLQLYGDNLSDEKGPTIWEQGRIIMPRPRTIGVRLSVLGL
ncbi:MAG: hypothetical protein BGN85_02500 [Alphaproteobacteria bacterium 64-11]|nr:MAG: hypothetical protein BGN85_02500 [Alphaproteobacteria bacterium 64-11]